VEKTLGFSYLRPISLDNIYLSKLSSLLTKSSKLYMQLGHAHNGHRAFFTKDYPQAIREFYLIFEYTGCPEEVKYRNLRNVVSRARLDSQRAIDDLKINFRIRLQKGQELDVNKPRIKAILYKHTKEFRKSVGLYLQEQLRIELAKKKKKKGNKGKGKNGKKRVP
jgi:hypothetical protein